MRRFLAGRKKLEEQPHIPPSRIVTDSSDLDPVDPAGNADEAPPPTL